MNYMKQVAEMLGLEWDDEKQESEEFKLKLGEEEYTPTYKLMVGADGFDVYICRVDGSYAYTGFLTSIFTGSVTIQKLPWRPKQGELYWYSTIDDYDKAYITFWDNDEYHKMRLDRGIVFRTREEAEARTDEILRLMGVEQDGSVDR